MAHFLNIHCCQTRGPSIAGEASSLFEKNAASRRLCVKKQNKKQNSERGLIRADLISADI